MSDDEMASRKGRATRHDHARRSADIGTAITFAIFVLGFGGMIWVLGTSAGVF